MPIQLRPFHFAPFAVLFASAFASCDLINPDEQIPSFIRIDSISLTTKSNEGNPVHNMVDAWVYDDEKLVGIYELPAIIPVLRNGEANIRIRGGVKLNGQVGTRVPLIFTQDLVTTIELFPDSIIHVNPTLSFRNDATFKWLEDFEGAGLSIESTTLSETQPVRVDGEEAFDGRSLKLFVSPDQNVAECRSIASYPLPGGGAPVFMEFTYRCNHPFVMGLFSEYPGGSFQVPIITLNPSENWNHIYINLTDLASSNTAYTGHRPFFGFIKDEGFAGEAAVYIDNIRIVH